MEYLFIEELIIRHSIISHRRYGRIVMLKLFIFVCGAPGVFGLLVGRCCALSIGDLGLFFIGGSQLSCCSFIMWWRGWLHGWSVIWWSLSGSWTLLKGGDWSWNPGLRIRGLDRLHDSAMLRLFLGSPSVQHKAEQLLHSCFDNWYRFLSSSSMQ